MTPNDFKSFSDAVRARFDAMANDTLFVVDTDRDEIWTTYLAAFPEGSNPVFRERTEHDCSCCRHFIRDIGNVVAIQNGALTSVWDLNGLPHPYQDVADAMSTYIKGRPVRNVFLTDVAKHGTTFNHEMTDSGTRRWDHFAVTVPKQFVKANYLSCQGELRASFQVLMRGVTELTPDAVSTVADLIDDNAIYRGEEFKKSVGEFQQVQGRVLALADAGERELLVWTLINNSVARFRNTVIGTLVQDLSEGMDLEDAVHLYESKVAPNNYKRPTALITKQMVENAMVTIRDMGLESALDRRHARLSDVSVNSVLFVDNSVQGQMKGGIEDVLMQEVRPAPFDPDKAKVIGIEAFVSDVLPQVTEMRLYLENDLARNFVSLTAPVHEDAASLFLWDNDFAWSYDGNVTDTIKDKVKRAGGRVEGVSMRISLAWFNTDDLDLHVTDPRGRHIFYSNKYGILDVDMNVVDLVRDPVENMRWINTPDDGIYRVSVHNFTKRESADVGFVVEIENGTKLDTLRFDKAVPAKEHQLVANITVRDGQVVDIQPHEGIKRGQISREQWGLKTLDLVRVNSVVLSPNHWDGNAAGNKHWFFILDGCRNPEPVRGIYNEFLKPELQKHRKVFEVLGDKTKCAPIPDQLSGVGFSSTRKDKVTVMAMGPNLNRPYTIAF